MLANTKKIGSKGEETALKFLLAHGYTLEERNYRYRRGEVDLIMRDHTSQLIFVEVKTRKNNSFGEPEDFVSENQISSILRVADYYTEQHGWQGMIRFDIISITMSTGELQHYKDAFG